jgi:uncharacterized YigZ family protein
LGRKSILYTVKNEVQREIKVKKSRFISSIFPVSSLKEAEQIRARIKKRFSDAAHHPFGLRVGCKRITERYSDDGEPPKSSGFPILQVLKNESLTNTLIVVTRYFGGTKLGLGGLNRAYRESASLVVNDAKKKRYVPLVKLKVVIKDKYAGKVRNSLVRFGARVLEEQYQNKPYYVIEIEKSKGKGLVESLKNITKGEIEIVSVNR